MSDPKPFASLSSGLLARKGAAKPAMRPQGFGQMNGFGLEDLGWNDMGQAPRPAEPQLESFPEHVPSSIAALTPAPRIEAVNDEPLREEEAAPPVVVEQQRLVAASFAQPEPPRASVIPLPPRPRQERGAKAKAAFTLRLDTDRHLKLRLACAVAHRSAQQIVTQALDEYLAALPELDTLAGQVPAQFGNRG